MLSQPTRFASGHHRAAQRLQLPPAAAPTAPSPSHRRSDCSHHSCLHHLLWPLSLPLPSLSLQRLTGPAHHAPPRALPPRPLSAVAGPKLCKVPLCDLASIRRIQSCCPGLLLLALCTQHSRRLGRTRTTECIHTLGLQ